MPELGWEVLEQAEKDRLLEGMATGEISGMPRTIQIDWTDRCNIDCFFCSQAEMRRGGGELGIDLLHRCFEEMDEMGVATLNVAGGGDPLFHRQIGVVLEAVAAHRFRIGTVTTNGVLAQGRTAESLLRATRGQIAISLNSLGAEDYARVMRTSVRNYARVIDNVRHLVTLRNGAPAGPRIALQFLVHDGTFRQLPAMLELANELGVDRVGFNPLLFFDDQSRQIRERSDDFLSVVAQVFRGDERGIVADIRTIHPELNQRIDRLRKELAPERYAVTDLQHRNFSSLQSFCALPWFNMHVKGSGEVYPCCALLTPGFTPLGNVYDKSLRDIWEDGPYRNFRRSHAGFVRRVREQDPKAAARSGLPATCTHHGACFLRALPYLDDTAFAVSVDGLGRALSKAEVSFPSRLVDAEPARLNGTLSAPLRLWSGRLLVRVNRVPCGRAVRRGQNFAFEFSPAPLTDGFHLLEVLDGRGRVLAARMVEKVSSAAIDEAPEGH